MSGYRFFTLLLFILLILAKASGQDIFRFEHLNSEDGLSQNTGSSLLSDSRGFLWIGTMNGLNRYDGYQFKIYKTQNQQSNVFTNNRIIKLWEDEQKFIWNETYDGYYHYLNPKTELFNTFPEYGKLTKTKNSKATCFLQYSADKIWIGTSAEGVYELSYNKKICFYSQALYSDKGKNSISNNNVRFIIADRDSSIWIGTKKGINLLTKKDISESTFQFQHLFINHAFNSSAEIKHEVWFGTDNNGIVVYNRKESAYRILNTDNSPLFKSNQISNIYNSGTGIVFIAFRNNGIIAYNSNSDQWMDISVHGSDILNIYFDKKNNAWITATKFGVSRVDLTSMKSEFYELTPSKQKAISDRERHFFYEDRDSVLWIGLHGGALTYFDKSNNKFKSYVNNTQNPNSISSNIVHCITEDLTGLMWLGTGQYKGGIEKVIRKNTAFTHLIPEPEYDQITDNVVRSISQDKNGFIWAGTKNGKLYVYDSTLEKIHTFNYFKTKETNLYNTNIYAIFFDSQNYIWLGSKGHGLLVSTKPLPKDPLQYHTVRFNHYVHNPSDSTSISNNNIYSIVQDPDRNIWIGTFGNGVCKTTFSPSETLKFQTYSSEHHQLSNKQVRNLYFDSDSNLWVATSMGLNLLPADSIKKNRIFFRNFYQPMEKFNSINYNDVVHIYEDSKKQLWFGTFGGGVNKTSLPVGDSIQFKSITTNSGLSNNVIFGILEEKPDQMWFSSENGLSRYNENDNRVEIFNQSNGLSFNNFSENTCLRLKDGRILFGGSQGIEIFQPNLLKEPPAVNLIELTNFQLFNKDVIVGAKNSPLKHSITHTNKIKLTHTQSSFSITYSALDLLDPQKTQYSFLLEGFDENWNTVGNQTKATYTNLTHGDYIFRVKCTNRSGQWSTKERLLKITILPPWWKTIPAIILYVIIIVFLFILIRKVILKMNKYRNDLTIEKTINEHKLKFFTNISHEIRTPLTLILGPIEDLLHSPPSKDDTIKQLRMIRKNAKRMLQLTNQLLDFRKVQNNKMQLKVRKIELSSFTKNIYENFIPLANHKNIVYTFNASNPVYVWGDKSKLDSIIYNLLSNAIKFTPENKKVIINVGETDQNNAIIMVIDEGPGIPAKNISDIFTRYHILSNHDFAGTGIGLSLAYELARLHGGNITVNSTVNAGSSFSFSMPMDKEKVLRQPNVQLAGDNKKNIEINHHIDIEDLPSEADIEIQSDSLPNILIVEDNDEIASYTKNSLKSKYTCHIASTGKEGLRLARIQNPDVIITDIMMPEMDGIEMTRLLKEDFATCHIPIIIMTAKTDIQDKIDGFETGAESYITKPLNMNYLKAVIKNIIKQRNLVISKYRDNKTIDPKILKVNSKDEEFLKKISSYIENNYSSELSVERLANLCCVSRTVFYNKVKGLTGLSPLEFTREMKMKIALQLLQKGFSVSEVAFQIGYTDVKYFSKQFKLLYAYPPSKMKR